jgi:uncharacterized membrane-anchored protein
MNQRIERGLIVIGLLLVLGFVHWTIVARERLIAEGRVVLLELAPVDPRSLMQGDYMALRFRIRDAVHSGPGSMDGRTAGTMIVELDNDSVASFRRIEQGEEALAPHEQRLRFKLRRNELRIATNAFFFREGTGESYRGAKFGEFRVAESGDALLVALRDKDRVVLGTAR